MTSLLQRRQVIALVGQATQAGTRQGRACAVICLSERTLQRWQREQCQADRRPARVQAPNNRLGESERQAVLAVANSDEFGHLAPSQLVPRLAEPLGAAVAQLPSSPEHAVKGRFRGDVLTTVGQSGNDLAGRHVTELVRVGHGQNGLTFGRAEPVGGRLHPRRAPVCAQHVALPALQGALAQANDDTGALLARARLLCPAHQRNDLAALQ